MQAEEELVSDIPATGIRLRIKGLVASTELNGLTGIVKAPLVKNENRIPVALETEPHRKVNVKPENVDIVAPGTLSLSHDS